ncbi:CPBP family intramembrane metalloprotease [bacterium]|nr:CPBP family intramembrane metalloprotease [candidate division CSSED10-310 bacterium]
MMLINWKDIQTVFHKEIVEIMRNKRIIVTAFLIPMAIYPIVIFGMDWLQSLERRKIEEEGYRIAVSRNMSDVTDFICRSSDVPVTILYADSVFHAVRDGEADLGIEWEDRPGEDRNVWFFYTGSEDRSIKAFSEIEMLFSDHGFEWSRRFLAQDLALEHVSRFEPERIVVKDIATLKEQTGHRIGKILPFILLMMLVSGCSFAAIDMIAGEKERGCFETILVSGISRRSVIVGKMAVVVMTGLVSLLVNVLSMLIWLKLGMMQSIQSTDTAFDISFAALAGIFICSIPLTLIIAAILILISARAKSYQSGQTLLMPVTFASLVPAVAAVLPGMHSDSFLVALPIANVVVTMREMLEGTFIIWPFFVGNIINLGVASALVYSAVNSLNTEGRLIPGTSGGDMDGLLRMRRDPIRTAFMGFAIVWLLFFYVAVPLQARDLVSGLVFTLWGLILVSAFVLVRIQNLPVRETMGFRNTHWKVWVGSIVFQTGILPLILYLNQWVMNILPIPSDWMEAFSDTLTGDLSKTTLILLMCISPGICEEMLFRGAIFGSLKRKWSPWHAVIVSSIMFGFLHFSVYRLFPTTVIGIALGWLVMQSGSIYPAMLAHALNNFLSLIVAPELELDKLSSHWMLVGLPAVILGVMLVCSGSGKRRR